MILNRLFDRALTECDDEWHLHRIVAQPCVTDRVHCDICVEPSVCRLDFPPSVGWFVWVLHYILRTDPELALYGRYVVSKRLNDEGFEFEWPDLAGALQNLLRSGA